MSSLSNSTMTLSVLFKKNLGSIADPIKKATNPIVIVIVRLGDNVFRDSSKNIEKRKMTIRGLKIWFFRMSFLFKKLKKFSLGYSFLK